MKEAQSLLNGTGNTLKKWWKTQLPNELKPSKTCLSADAWQCWDN